MLAEQGLQARAGFLKIKNHWVSAWIP